MGEQLVKELEEAGILPEDAELMAEVAVERQAEFAETGQLASLFGMKALGATQEGVDACIGAGAALVKQGLYLKATEFFVGLMQFEPFHPHVHMWLGLCAQKQKLYGRALQFYRHANGLCNERKDPLILFYLGEMALLLDEPEEGIEALEKGLALGKGKKELAQHIVRAEKLLASAKERTNGK